MSADSFSTAATEHPFWEQISTDLGRRFEHSDHLRTWAIELVSAQLLGVPHRVDNAKRVLGELASNDVITICRGYGVDI